ncbi:MAG: ribulose-phosphate 3-epimerase [Acidimicrobiia bacterium]
MLVAPSILAADFSQLAASVARVEAVADRLHVDAMDGHFVPNLSFGPPVIAALRPHTVLYFDCHLMLDNPGELLDAFVNSGANGITVHIELGDPRPLFDRIRSHGVDVGLTLNPDTPIDAVMPYLHEIDTLLIMSVHPGFGGQGFIPEVLEKVRVARAEIDACGLGVLIEIDGGITPETAVASAASGVDILVAGTSVFHAPDPAARVEELRAIGTRARLAGANRNG